MKNAHLASIAIFACMLASPAMALDVKRTAAVAASPEETWKAIGDFCGLANWHPAISACELSKGADLQRTLGIKGGGTVVEKELGRSDAAHEYSYAIIKLDAPIPVDSYRSTIKVEPSASGSMIVWTGSFNAKGATDEKAVATITGFYDAGLAALQSKLGK